MYLLPMDICIDRRVAQDRAEQSPEESLQLLPETVATVKLHHAYIT